jgi:ElaB/YqjD/DUF883 family membrane-anchored ribosome-binding protein
MKSKPEISTTPKALLNDLQALGAQAGSMMSESLSEHSTEALDTLRAQFEALQRRFAVLYKGSKEKVVAGAQCTDAAIRDNPYRSLAIAAGVGLLLGVLLGRSRD